MQSRLNVLHDIRRAQIEAGERAVIANLPPELRRDVPADPMPMMLEALEVVAQVKPTRGVYVLDEADMQAVRLALKHAKGL